MAALNLKKQRDFAVEVVRRLREADFEAYWAGGCVRDRLLGRVPKDYDVATSATPREIRRLFGHRRTLAIGAAFGVITVIGPKPAGMVEVTTFRCDAQYTDGRHPDRVTFSSAEEDVSRRDFTVNGLFYDPIEDRVIDFVGGRKDLAEGLLRAIGRAADRFAEDKLRLLRAIRFTATFGFRLEEKTRAAIREMASEIGVVSPERIAMEMRRMLVDSSRTEAIRLLCETKLAAGVLPEIVPEDETSRRRLDHALAVLDRLAEPDFPLALGTLLYECVDFERAKAVCGRWKLSNQETDRICWLVEHGGDLTDAPAMRFSALQPILIHPAIEDLLALHDAVTEVDDSQAGRAAADHCRTLLAQPRDMLDPAPLLTGDDLLSHGIPAGPEYRILLQRVRNAQLDGELTSRKETLATVDRWRSETKGSGKAPG